MPLSIVRNNITDMQADAIVNTANPLPAVGTGVDAAVHMAAGPALLEAREKIGLIPRGCSAITPAFHLPAKYVIHTVGPVWLDGEQGEEATLRSCYASALKLAAEHNCESVAFPLISAGNYGFPKALALQTAISTISGFLMEYEDMMVYLVVFDKTAYSLSEKLFNDVKSYIDENLVEEIKAAEYTANIAFDRYTSEEWTNRRLREEPRYEMLDLADCCSASAPYPPMASIGSVPAAEKKERSLEDLLSQLGESFPETLKRMMDERGMKNSDVCKRANMDKKYLSKLLNGNISNPGKGKLLSLVIALQLNLDEARDFLGRAGYALTRSSKTDIIIQYFIETKNYNIFEVEQVLFEFTGETLAYY